MDAIEDAVTLRDLFNGLVLPGGGIRFRGDYFRTLECDEVLFWPARSIDAARALEALLIRRLYPKYNSRYSGELYR